jgi:hypothetical protein
MKIGTKVKSKGKTFLFMISGLLITGLTERQIKILNVA